MTNISPNNGRFSGRLQIKEHIFLFIYITNLNPNSDWAMLY